MGKQKRVTIQFKYRNDGAQYLFSEKDTKVLVDKFKEQSTGVVTFTDNDKGRSNANVHINLNTVGIVEEEDFYQNDT